MSDGKRPEEEEWGPWRVSLDWRPPYTGGQPVYGPLERVREPPDNEALLTKVLAELQRLGRERAAESPVIDRGEGTPEKPGRRTKSLEQKLGAWNGWLKVQGRMTQHAYCEQLDPPIRPRTLRNWRDDLRREKLID